MSEVDKLAQDIRQVDGNHSLGAGALAEKLIERGWCKNQPPSMDEIEAELKAILAGDIDLTLVRRHGNFNIGKFHSERWVTSWRAAFNG